MKHLLQILCAFFLTLSSPTWAISPAPQTESLAITSWPQLLNYAKNNFPLEGRLVTQPDGFTYIKVDDRYIVELFPLLGLKEEGFLAPPYFRTKDAPGAHISVFYVDEHVAPEEVGQTFRFDLEQIVIVQPSHDTRYAVLQVKAPELEQLRKKYGLTPKLHNQEYHISLAKQKLKR
ncbi:Uncharacterized protein PHSC3_001798 [Chlamydiales bacterium STE3]|nr:Uncharacterized protein PHSC3_001798 [Chlamydiales bacterium STE3]